MTTSRSHAAQSITQRVTLKSLLDEMTDTAAVARWPEPNFISRQASSYDRASIAPDKPGWFANSDYSNYIRTEEIKGRRENVLLDTNGPGAVVRFWMTSNDNRRGTLRFYFDNAPMPALEVASYDLMASALAPSPLLHPHPSYRADGGGGSTCYLPLPYAKGCKITWEEADATKTGPRYYHINTRTYAPGTAVETFSSPVLRAARPQIERVCQTLLNPPASTAGTLSLLSQVLGATDSASLMLPVGPAAVQQLEMSFRTPNPLDREQVLRGVILKMSFDGEPTVWCPVSDFAGSGVGSSEVKSWYRTVADDGTMTCRWVMPYHQSARIELLNLSAFSVTAQLTARVAPWRWDERSMHFHATWHQQIDVPTKPDSDWNFLKVQGHGVLVGDTLAVFNPVRAWYGEGDEKIWVDNELFPSHFGTGTEDYYNSSWAPTPVYHMPFANGPRVDQWQSQGHNTYTRSRNLDTIPFNNSLQFDMEIEHWRNPKINIAATTYWYASPAAKSNWPPLPVEAMRILPTLAQLETGFKVAGALECENLTISARSDDLVVEPQDMTPFAGRWSSGAHLLLKAQKVGAFVELKIPASPGKHTLLLFATQAPDYGQLHFRVNGQSAKTEFDGYSPTVRVAAPIELGVFEARERQITLRVEVSGANAQSSGLKYLCGLDCIVLRPFPNDSPQRYERSANLKASSTHTE